MKLNDYLKIHFDQLSLQNICNDNEFITYENFKKFIFDHYKLDHIEKNNYIKYVKIKRQILKENNEKIYNEYINEINDIIKILSSYNIFPNINIKRYMFKFNIFFKLIQQKKNSLQNTIITIRELFYLRSDKNFNYKIMNCLNTIIRRYHIFCKYSKKLIYLLNKFIELENNNGIDHKLIELNNDERSLLGKKSEYIVNKLILEYVNKMNILNKKKYFYEYNINFIKLLNIDINHENNIKGEIDGMIIIYDGYDYIIEKLIEVKSSIKATFEDLDKFLFLQLHINNLDENTNIKFNNYTFTKKSFKNIILKDLTQWVTYICVNFYCRNIIEKSHLYFSTVLKILDDDFIDNFYINNTELNKNIDIDIDKCILKKYKIIENNRELINDLFKIWEKNIKLGYDDCNIFISRLNPLF